MFFGKLTEKLLSEGHNCSGSIPETLDFDKHRTAGRLAATVSGFVQDMYTRRCKAVLLEEAVQVLPAVLFLYEYGHRLFL